MTAPEELRPAVVAEIHRPFARLVSLYFLFGGNGWGGKGWGFAVGGGGFWSGRNARRVAVIVTAVAGLALAASYFYSRRRKQALSLQFWRYMFTSDGRISDPTSFLKKVCAGGVVHELRAEIWPFLLGHYSLNSTKAERLAIQMQKRKEYYRLRLLCEYFLSLSDDNLAKSKDLTSQRKDGCVVADSEEEETSGLTCDFSMEESGMSECGPQKRSFNHSFKLKEIFSRFCNIGLFKKKISDASTSENFLTWQRIIRLDALRANAEWITYSPTQAAVSKAKACQLAEDVHLLDYDHLKPCKIYHAARLVSILEAYAIYDSEIGYCQGMSDLLAPLVAIFEEDHDAFWCFVGFMKRARHNFRLDEVGIRRQLNIVSQIIKIKDYQLYTHLEKLQAEDCFFVYRMVVVLFRRELTFEQTLCLWEVMWANQAAVQAGMEKFTMGRILNSARPTDDLLLYAIAASVLRCKKQIMEKYNSLDEILCACNSIGKNLDVWKLLDDAHILVAMLHNRIESAQL